MITARRQQEVFFTTKHRKSGWTLLEMILGGVIAALVGLILFQVLVNGVETYKRAQVTARVYIQMYKVFDALDQDLASAIRVNYSAVDPAWQSFSGDEHSMRLVRSSQKGLQEISYDLRSNSDGYYALRRAEQPLLARLRHQPMDLNGIMIAKRLPVDGLEFFFGKKAEGDAREAKLEWAKSWKSDGLPLAVKVTLKCTQDSAHGFSEFNRIFYLPNH